MNMDHVNCANCRFADKSYGGEVIFCVRYAPRPLVVQADEQGPHEARWPEVSASDYCGEWQPPIQDQSEAMP